jgi:hypothetical protein
MLYFFHELFLVLILLVIIGIIYFDSKVLIILLLVFIILYRRTLYCFYCLINLYFYGLRKKYTEIPKIVTKMYTNMFNIHHNFHKLPKYNTIFVANHPYHIIDLCSIQLIPTKLCFVVGGTNVTKYIIKPICGTNHIFFNMNIPNNFDNIKAQIKEKIHQSSIIVLVERYSLMISNKNIAPLRRGMFNIAKDLNIPITPLLLDSVRTTNGVIDRQPFEIVVGETMVVDDVKRDCRNVRKFMIKEKRRLELNKKMDKYLPSTLS